MSFSAMQAVLDHSQTTGPDRAIMLILAYRADEKGSSFPGLHRIASDTGLTRRTVYRRLPFIVAMGELSIQHGGQSVYTHGGKQVSNRYTITLKGRDTQSPPYSKAGTDSHKGRDTQTRKGGTHSHKGRDRQSPELKGNRNNQPTPNPKAEKPEGGDNFPIRRLPIAKVQP